MSCGGVIPFAPILLPTHVPTAADQRRMRKAEKQALMEGLRAKQGIIGELERRVAQLITSARIKHEREKRVRTANPAVPDISL